MIKIPKVITDFSVVAREMVNIALKMAVSHDILIKIGDELNANLMALNREKLKSH